MWLLFVVFFSCCMHVCIVGGFAAGLSVIGWLVPFLVADARSVPCGGGERTRPPPSEFRRRCWSGYRLHIVAVSYTQLYNAFRPSSISGGTRCRQTLQRVMHQKRGCPSPSPHRGARLVYPVNFEASDEELRLSPIRRTGRTGGTSLSSWMPADAVGLFERPINTIMEKKISCDRTSTPTPSQDYIEQTLPQVYRTHTVVRVVCKAALCMRTRGHRSSSRCTWGVYCSHALWMCSTWLPGMSNGSIENRFGVAACARVMLLLLTGL